MYNLKCLSENLRRNKDYLEKEAKSILKDHPFTVDVLEEVGEEKLEEMLVKFADIYNGRYGHKYDKTMEYDARALPLFFFYGYMAAKMGEENGTEQDR